MRRSWSFSAGYDADALAQRHLEARPLNEGLIVGCSGDKEARTPRHRLDDVVAIVPDVDREVRVILDRPGKLIGIGS